MYFPPTTIFYLKEHSLRKTYLANLVVSNFKSIGIEV